MNYKEAYRKAAVSNIVYKTILTGDIARMFRIAAKITQSELIKYADIQDFILLGSIVNGINKNIVLSNPYVWFIWDSKTGKRIGQFFSTKDEAEEAIIKMFGYYINGYEIRGLDLSNKDDVEEFRFVKSRR